MFKKVTKSIVNQVDPDKELVPVESIAHHEQCFRPFCLLAQKRKPDTLFHPCPYYQPTGFRLDDVLLPGEDGKSTELLEHQLLLLLQSLERKIVSQQLKLVENLLEHDLEERDEPFHVDARLLSFPRREEQSLTMDLVKLSGVKLQEDGLAVPMERPFKAVVALYIALYVLNFLSSSKEVVPGLAQTTTWLISAHQPLQTPSSILLNARGRFGWHMQM